MTENNGVNECLTLELDPEIIRTFGYRVIDIIVEELSNPRERPIFPPEQNHNILEANFGGALPEEGTAPEDLLAIIQNHLLPAVFNANHPNRMGYVASSPVPLPGLIDALVNALKITPKNWVGQPGSTQIELIVTRWLGQMAGFSSNAAGTITTGGTIANMVGLAVGRVRCAGWDVRTNGLADHSKLVAYVSTEAHSSLDKSVELLGIGRNQLRKIEVGHDYRIRLDLLEEAIKTDLAAGHRPFCLIGNAGTVNTGAVDPLNHLADIAERFNLWFHVDGAFGAFAAMVPEARSLFAGIDRADSLVMDPHKWLNIPLEAGCILVRNWDDLGDTFSLVPPYLRAGTTENHHDHWHYSFELSRTDRALKVWLALRHYGVDRYRRMIAYHLNLTRHLAAWVEAAEDFELMSEPSLSVCCFRFVPPDLGKRTEDVEAYLDHLNLEIESIQVEDGRTLVSGTELDGRRVLRACIVNHLVTRKVVEETLGTVQELGYKLDKQLRASQLG